MAFFAPVPPMNYLDTYDVGTTDSPAQPGHQTLNEEVSQVGITMRTRQPQSTDGFPASNLSLLRALADFGKDS
jgi:hypothetical protein